MRALNSYSILTYFDCRSLGRSDPLLASSSDRKQNLLKSKEAKNIEDIGWLEQNAPELLKIIKGKECQEFYPNRTILIPPSLDCHWRVISSDRKWQLHKGTKLQCQRFVDSFADRDAIAIAIPNGDVVAIANSLIIERLRP